jgi:hypothetical protein
MELLAYILNFFDCDTNVTIVTDIATKLIYFNTQEKASITAPTPPYEGGFVFVFPIVFRPFFPKVGKQSQPYELVSILTSTIYVLSSRAHYARKTPSKYDIFDTLIRHF